MDYLIVWAIPPCAHCHECLLTRSTSSAWCSNCRTWTASTSTSAREGIDALTGEHKSDTEHPNDEWAQPTGWKYKAHPSSCGCPDRDVK
jgi:hypothetical protein